MHEGRLHDWRFLGGSVERKFAAPVPSDRLRDRVALVCDHEVGQLALGIRRLHKQSELRTWRELWGFGKVALAEHFTAVEYAADWTQDAVEGVTHVLALRPAVKCPRNTTQLQHREELDPSTAGPWAVAAAWVDDDWWGKASHARLETRVAVLDIYDARLTRLDLSDSNLYVGVQDFVWSQIAKLCWQERMQKLARWFHRSALVFLRTSLLPLHRLWRGALRLSGRLGLYLLSSRIELSSGGVRLRSRDILGRGPILVAWLRGRLTIADPEQRHARRAAGLARGDRGGLLSRSLGAAQYLLQSLGLDAKVPNKKEFRPKSIAD